MAARNAVGANTGYPMANLQTPTYSNPAMQRPEATNVIAPSADAGVGAYSGEQRFAVGGPAFMGPTQANSPPQGPAFMGPTQANSPPQGPAFMGPIGSGYIGAGNYNENARLGGETEAGAETGSGYKYSYDPNTMQFTQTGGPGVSKTPTGEELAQGVAAHDMLKRFNEHILTGNPYNSTPSFVSGATPRGRVTGGIATPAMSSMQAQPQPQRPTTPINIPAYQSPEQQLGLGGFYDMMNQQLSGYGGFSGYANGGNVGGESHLGDYSDGGRLLKGPGDGVSDSIPASIGGRQSSRSVYSHRPQSSWP